MRLQFKTLRYKNILSTGNAYTSINLDGKSSTLISGANGAGKSTFLDAIVFGLYGKPFRKINKPQLLNSINGKDLQVEVKFTVGGSEYMVRRGIRPNIFEIIKDGTLLNQDSAKKDYQAFLEQNILGINYKSFNQIVVLGSATYVPFMELPAQTRRDIIEDLLDIQVFSTMGLLAKDKISQNKDEINDNRYQGEILESNITLTEENNKAITKIRQTEVDKIKDKMQEHIVKIEEKQELIESIETIINDLISQTADKPTVKSKLEKTLGVQRDLENARRGHEKEILFYHDNDNCPTCKQGIDHEFKTEITAEKEEKTKELEEGIAKLDIKITEFRDRAAEISDLEDIIKTKNLDISENRGEIRISKNALKSYKEELQGAEQELGEVDKSGLAQLKNDFDAILKDRETLFEDQSVLSVVSTILKDGGIKTRIIRQYIPVMNKLINKYLSAFELFVDFHLDENFNDVIRSRFRYTFSYGSFSEGEKLRISLSIMLAWRSVAKLRNSVSTNLLILDETLDGALDGLGIDSLIETLHNLNSDDNIFVISHRGDQFAEKFSDHLKFKKVGNFSEIAAK
jgi:DNA repair exonuclease SbcCD ATPase subunit